jgi:hypothetical protein
MPSLLAQAPYLLRLGLPVVAAKLFTTQCQRGILPRTDIHAMRPEIFQVRCPFWKDNMVPNTIESKQKHAKSSTRSRFKGF